MLTRVLRVNETVLKRDLLGMKSVPESAPSWGNRTARTWPDGLTILKHWILDSRYSPVMTENNETLSEPQAQDRPALLMFSLD